MRTRMVAVSVWSWFGLLTAFAVALVVFVKIGPEGTRIAPSLLLPMLGGFLFLGLGALLASRRPGNAVGPLLMATGTAYVIPFDDLARMLSQTSVADGAWWPTLLLIDSLTLVLYLFPLPLLLLLFPTGRVPGPRWRWLLRGELVLVLLTVVLTVLAPQWGGPEEIAIPNPLYATFATPFERLMVWIGPVIGVAIFVMPLLGAAALLARYRGAEAVERTQVRWLLYAGALYATTFILSSVFGDSPLSGPLFIVGLSAIPLAVTVAILRHRLFDIDVIIRRTLQYGALTAILGGLYFGSVLLLQTLLGPLIGGADSPPVVIVSTLALAALFNPLRLRVQRFIDRRFYRSKVHAERALTRFAALARDEVDLNELRSALFGVVGETLQPERMGLWLRPTKKGESGSG